MQITSGIRRLLSSPLIYSQFQNLMGAKKGWEIICKDYLCINTNMSMLDIGCGPADVLNYLPDGIDYWGFDISKDYIDKAQQKFNNKGHFSCKFFENIDLEYLPKFDRVLMSGVLHHMEDEDAIEVLKLVFQSLKEGGKLITIDPCYDPNQSKIARFLVSKDRGQNVRYESQYTSLVTNIFSNINVKVVHKRWIPYTHCYMVCEK